MEKFLYCSKKGFRIVSFKNKPTFQVLDIKEIDIETLSQAISAKDIISVSFEANLYVDAGDFVSLSKLATYTAIKNAVNNFGIFGRDFEVSFKKLKQIDKTKATYYYVAVGKDSFDFIDNLDCVIKQCVPDEIAIKNLFCANYTDDLPALAIIENDDFIKAIAFDNDRLLSTKTIRKEGFGVEAQELIQFTQGTLAQHKIKNIYFLGSSQLQDSLHEASINVQQPAFKIGNLSQDQILDYIGVLGLLYKNDINFLTPKHQSNYLLFKHTRNAIRLAAIVFVVGLFVLFAGFSNYFKILGLTEKLNDTLTDFKQNIGSINTNINATSMQNSVNLYAQISKTPKLSYILADLSTYKLPNLYFIEASFTNSKFPDAQNATSNQTLGSFEYSVNIKGVVFGTLDKTKSEFNTFLREVSNKYNIELSNFYYLDGKLLFDVNLEDKNVSF
ncbi:hypothetical protein DESAMIL20_1669 [Desulfurella amilsii]|uniref:Uncharacterized protein n=1 Tax=Desulfurella amilsii TaxID=1562698 RepID=A0A1X4XX58_9BACT|nr:hypothetical protein [Desulfurella amilsii]OSS42116.1 hypothetical protein DESAMIL20_1669 [Desulfurella amilsii]